MSDVTNTERAVRTLDRLQGALYGEMAAAIEEAKHGLRDAESLARAVSTHADNPMLREQAERWLRAHGGAS